MGGTSSTAGNVIAASFFATTFLMTHGAHNMNSGHTVQPSRYTVPNNGSTGQRKSPFATEIWTIGSSEEIVGEKFYQTVTHFYDNLLRAQQPLGKDVAKALYENLWDLYAR